MFTPLSKYELKQRTNHRLTGQERSELQQHMTHLMIQYGLVNIHKAWLNTASEVEAELSGRGMEKEAEKIRDLI